MAIELRPWSLDAYSRTTTNERRFRHHRLTSRASRADNQNRMVRIFTTGVFDILHRGHLNILTQAAALGELMVGIMTDQGVQDTKGLGPILTLEERDAQIRSLPFVPRSFTTRTSTSATTTHAVKPDIVVQGDDWLFSADRIERARVSARERHPPRLAAAHRKASPRPRSAAG